MEHLEPWALKAVADAALQRAADQLAAVVRQLAASLRPFPAFQGLATVQAIEVEPGPFRDPQRGCVVVTPEGELCELELDLLPGVPGGLDVDQVETFKPLELPPLEYIAYAAAAIEALARAHQGGGAGRW